MRISPMVLVVSMLASTAHAQLGPLQQQVLDIHNRERAAVGAPPLRWNAELERGATQHVQQLARTGRLAHAPRDGRGIVRENLSQGLLGWGPELLMRNWLGEKRYFHGGIYPDVCTGGWLRCAHYTQVIWPGTTEVGCGMAAGGRFSWFVCRYSPGGNKDGRHLGAVYRAPGQPSNLSIFCASSGKELRGVQTRLEQLKAERAWLAAEMARVQRAIQAAIPARYDPSLLERLLGTTQAPNNEQLIALHKYLAELQGKMRSNQVETKALLERLQKLQDRSTLC